MKLRRCFSLLLAVLLAVMSFAFSASKAWASQFTPPVLPAEQVSMRLNGYMRYYWSGYSFSSDGFSTLNTISPNHYMNYELVVPAGTYSCLFETQYPYFSVGSNSAEFSIEYGVFRSQSYPVPVAVFLCYQDSSFDVQGFIPMDIEQYDSLRIARYTYDGSYPNMQITGVCFFFAEPSSSRPLSEPADSSYRGISRDFNMEVSSLRVKWISAPSGTDKYQNNVSSGLKDIGNSVKKGFSAVTGAIGGAASAVGDKIGQVKDAVVQQGQAVAEKVTEVKEAVIERTTEIKDTVVEKTDEVKQTIIEKLAALGNFIIDGLKELFIPSEDYFPGLFERLNTFFSNRFGFLYFPIEHFISLIGKLMNLQDVAPSIAIPELSYEGQVFIPAMTYTFDFLSQEPFKTVHDYYLLAIDAALIAAFIGLLHRKYEEVMRN